MTHRDLRDATEDADHDLSAYYGRHVDRARAEADASTAEREPVEVDPLMVEKVAALLSRLQKPVSTI